jgi:hypothetical protein
VDSHQKFTLYEDSLTKSATIRAWKKIDDELSALLDAEKMKMATIKADDSLLGYEKLHFIDKLKMENDRKRRKLKETEAETTLVKESPALDEDSDEEDSSGDATDTDNKGRGAGGGRQRRSLIVRDQGRRRIGGRRTEKNQQTFCFVK